jgi:triacylglycerol lipase
VPLQSNSDMVAQLTRVLLLLQVLIAAMIGYIVMLRLPAMPAWLAAICGIGSVLCVRALITANNFRLARHLQDNLLPPRLGWRRAAAMYLRELAATLRSSSWSMPFGRMGAAPTVYDGSLPVLLIHGYGCNSGYWQCLAKHLRKARVSFLAIDLEPVFGDIDNYLAQTMRAMDQLSTATGQRRVILVGHSMGGLVARAWVRTNGLERVAKVITIGTPHAGTALARFGFGKNARQMRRHPRDTHSVCNAWLAELGASEVRGRMPLVSLYSRHDNIVAPHGSAVFDGAKNIGFDGVGHVALGSDPAVIACILHEIEATAAHEAAPI